MATTIKLKNSVTTTNAPSSLVQGEVAINITDKKVWVGNAAGTPIQLLGAGGSASFGALTCTSLTNSGLTSGRVTYAGTGGLLQDSANLTFNGTTLTANDITDSSLTANRVVYATTNGNLTNSANLTFDGTTLTTVNTINVPNTFGFKNRIINGAMVIDQRNAGASVTQGTGNSYVVDRFLIGGTVTSKFTAQQNAGSVTPPTGFINYLGCTSSSAYSVGASETFNMQQRIEGLNVADLGWGTANAKTVTLSFWVRSSLTGTFGGSLRNSAADRSYPFTYTISAANTWEQKSITVAGDTTGTWLTTSGIGINVTFSLGTGSTLSGTANAWAAGNFPSATGAVSVVGTNGATFYITGVQLEVGSTATIFDYRPYGTELALCQRYYYRLKSTGDNYPYGFAQCYSTTLAGALIPFPVTMRVAPSALEQSGTAGNYGLYSSSGASQTCTSVPVYAGVLTTTAYGAVNFTVASGIVGGDVTQAHAIGSSGYLGWSAEL